MAPQAASDLERQTALRTYEHARDANVAQAHRLDVVDEPMRHGARPSGQSATATNHAQSGPMEIRHSVETPTMTAFKLAFGFAAGSLLARFIQAVVVGVLLLIVLEAMLTRLIHA